MMKINTWLSSLSFPLYGTGPSMTGEIKKWLWKYNTTV
jgi:hypothetical protein